MLMSESDGESYNWIAMLLFWITDYTVIAKKRMYI